VAPLIGHTGELSNDRCMSRVRANAFADSGANGATGVAHPNQGRAAVTAANSSSSALVVVWAGVPVQPGHDSRFSVRESTAGSTAQLIFQEDA
jgi:hypothetical protein